MQIPIYQVDAFTSAIFRGNPAAVCPLEAWTEDALLQAIAAENNLSETAFLVAEDEHYVLRWFTPRAEVNLCGHATLAAAHVVFHFLNIHLNQVVFATHSGNLTVTREGSRLVMDLPVMLTEACEISEDLTQALGEKPAEVFRGRDYLTVFPTEAEIRNLQPDFRAMQKLDLPGVIATAPGDRADFVSRYFAPALGIPEDPVTGSAHCALTPFWSERLGKKEMQAEQLSERGGELSCIDGGDRVIVSGETALYLEGTINV